MIKITDKEIRLIMTLDDYEQAFDAPLDMILKEVGVGTIAEWLGKQFPGFMTYDQWCVTYEGGIGEWFNSRGGSVFYCELGLLLMVLADADNVSIVVLRG